MARSTEEVVAYNCDADCNVTNRAPVGELPKGFSGTVHLPDGTYAEWYACRKSHVAKAVLEAVLEAHGAALAEAKNAEATQAEVGSDDDDEPATGEPVDLERQEFDEPEFADAK